MAIAVALADLAIKKSRPYNITDLGTMAFEFANNALVGIKENVAGVLKQIDPISDLFDTCLLYTSPSPRDGCRSRMPSSA